MLLRRIRCLSVLALLATTPAMAQWTVFSNGTLHTGQPRITFGESGFAAQLMSNTDAVNMSIRNRTTGSLTFDYGSALVVRDGNGGGTIHAYMSASGLLGLGTISPQTELDVRGTTRTEVLEITGGSDVAELFEVAGTVEPGSVVAIDRETVGGLRISDSPYDRTVVGVVSGAGGVSAGMLLGQPGTLAYGSHPVAVSGRVYVKADTTNGAIQIGDHLTTSSRPGHVMKATDGSRMMGAIVGKALSPLSDETGLVLIVVALQ